jgi:EpsG family
MNWVHHSFGQCDTISVPCHRILNLVDILRIIVCVLFTFTWFVSPILSTLPIVAYLYFVRITKYELYFYFVLLAAIPGLINYTKTPLSDLLIYYDTYNELWLNDLGNITKTVNADFFFYYISAILAKISGGQQQLFVLFWSTVTYFSYFLALSLFARSLSNYRKKILVGIVFYSVFFGLNFSLSGHLVRQFAAVALLMYAIVLYSLEKRRYQLIFVLAVLSHFSTLIFVLGFYLGKINKTKCSWILSILFGCSLLIGFFNLLDLIAPLFGNSKEFFLLQEVSNKATFYVNKMDGEVSLRELLGMILLTALAFNIYIKDNSLGLKRFTIFFFLLIIFLVLMRGNDLLLLRYSYYVDFFASFILLLWFSKYWRYFCVKLIFFLIVITAPIRFIRLISEGPWDYIDNSSAILLNTVHGFLDFHLK